MFIDHLIDRIKEKNNPAIIGLDPLLEYVPKTIIKRAFDKHGKTIKGAAEAIYNFNMGIINNTYDLVAAIKPQLAYYELYGYWGIKAFYMTIQAAKERGLLVIADGKRNDIGSTATAYASAYLGEARLGSKTADSVFDVDALTVNPYLGIDGIRPFITDCERYGKGIFVLVKTSNASSGQIQDLIVLAPDAKESNLEIYGAEPNDAEPNDAEMNNAEMNVTEMNVTEMNNNAKMYSTEPNDAKMYITEPNDAKMYITEPNDAESYNADPNDAEPNCAKTNNAEMNGAETSDAEPISVNTGNTLTTGKTLYERVAEHVDEWGRDVKGKYGYSSIGAVVGATYPEQMRKLRRIMKSAYILVPGYGVQGGTGKDAAEAFNDDSLGAIVSASRSIMCAWTHDRWEGRYTHESYEVAARVEMIRMRDELNSFITK